MSHPRALAAVILVAGLLTPAQSARAQISFQDNFNSGPSLSWGNQRGSWFASGGVYDSHFPSNNPTTLSLLPFDLTDYSIDVDINSVQDGGIWLRSSYGGANTITNGVLLVTGGFGLTGTGLYWHIIQNGAFSGALNPVGGLFTSGVSNAHIRVVVSGNTYSAFVNGSATAATTLTTSLFADGLTGLYDFSGQTFDNVDVRGNVVGQSVAPEPASTSLLATGLVALGLVVRRKRR